VGWNVDYHRRIAQRPRREEELFVLALSAVRLRADADAVGDYLSADAAGTVVECERVPHAVQRVLERLLFELRKSLNRADLIVIDDRELAERLIAIGIDGGVPISPGRESSGVWARDHRVQVGMDNL